jgi:hypothetical protein
MYDRWSRVFIAAAASNGKCTQTVRRIQPAERLGKSGYSQNFDFGAFLISCFHKIARRLHPVHAVSTSFSIIST